jgi:hypothetical protein
MKLIDFRLLNHPDQRVLAWLGENGIDPGHVPADQVMHLDGKQLTYTAFVLEDGHKVMDPRISEHRWLKETRTVTLTTTPDAYGLQENPHD